MDAQLETIFGELGMSQYLETFVDQGFDAWDTILDITESDLDVLGVKLGHRRKLQRRIANSRGIAPDVALGSSSSTRTSVEERLDAPRPEDVKVAEVKDGVVTKRKYRRHPKPDENAPERPPSAYVLFSNKMREDLKGRSLTFTEIAKLVGENWQSLTPSEKEPYETQAQQAKERYLSDLAKYKKTPEYRRYTQYLHEFKLKHSSGNRQDKDSQKRPRLEAGTAAGRGITSNTSNGDVQMANDTVQASQRPSVVQDASSVSSTPLSFHATLDEALTSPVSQGPSFFEPMEHSPKPFQREIPNRNRPRRSSSWRSSEPEYHHSHILPPLSDVLDTRQASCGSFANSPEGNGYAGFMQSHHCSGPGPPTQGESRPAPLPLLRKEHSSAGSTSPGSGTRSGSTSACGSSSNSTAPSLSNSTGQSSAPAYSPFRHAPNEPSLPIHALLTSKSCGRYESCQGPGSQNTSQRFPPNDLAIFVGYQHPTRATTATSPGSIDHSSSGNGFQSPPQISDYPPPSGGTCGRAGGNADERPQSTDSLSKDESRGMDGMSALLRAGEIVDSRAR